VCAALAALVALALRKGPGGSAGQPPVVTADPAADLDAALRHVRQRTERRLAVTRGLAEGRASLWEAAARLRELDRALPPLPPNPCFRPWLDGPLPEAEFYCRDALHVARGQAGRDPVCRGRLDRWEEELEDRLAEGPVELPAPGSVRVAE
jgi:hypothetical protein